MTTLYVGVDISKKNFDAAIMMAGVMRTYQFTNDAVGFAGIVAVLSELGDKVHCVMEASGPYYLQLATHLFESGIAVSVVNPLVVKRYTQMLLLRAKTDRQDAKCLARYGEDQKPTEWQPNEQYINQLGQLQALLNQYIKQRTALNNQLDAQRSSGVPNPAFQASAEKIYKMLNDEIAQVEQQMKNLADQYHKEQMDALQTIPGIGKKTAMVLVLITHGFERFQNAKQLACFIGICPRVFQSGSSVKGKNKICKLGMSHIRQLLYLCSMKAIKVNKSCQALYERLIANGKPKMKALIAVAHKLLRQAFAIAKYQRTFDQNFA